MEFSSKKIRDLAVGDRVDCYFIIKRVDLKTTNSNDKKYLDFIFGDKTGEISGKLWEVPQDVETYFTEGDLVKVRGTVTSYMNNNQFKVDRIRKASDEDGVIPEDFVESAPLKNTDMLRDIEGYLQRIEDQDIHQVVRMALEEKKEKLMFYPAAKRNHHAIRSGLLYHVLTMLKLGDQISKVYPAVNTDLLFAGIILHDLEKINEMDSSELGIVKEYTLEGNLLGHISLGVKNVDRICDRLNTPEEKRMLLQHMILSHHYEPEYGSPVKPMFLEAELLHHIDMIDARVFDFTLAVRDLEPGAISESIFSLDRRRIYKPTF
ncbi:3'-5' exoribonuclease YhaM family protein [Proteiniclasticum ruminis]|uniref:3'-5' exoribonuclease n=1 Tax=Proteiniclasticum ruminis TaxID=398199 RepID=A0A1G8Q8N1_9CLOT|nr:HD domain-containing protein [Proteiniclasticum ruminis]MBP9920473.1 HD domain-containing protein [Proteiniclasticum sp.]SDJ00815.1 3'-5' exoribonuclease [Proteiniclasticum ruminis]